MTLAFVAGLVALDLILSILHTRLQLLLLIVKLVLQCKEVLIQGDTVTQKRFIAACLVLLVNLLILEHLDLVLHGGNLAMQVQNDVFMNGIRLAVFLPPRRQLLDLVSGLRQFRVALKFLVKDGTGSPRVHIEVIRCKLDVASLSASAPASSRT